MVQKKLQTMKLQGRDYVTVNVRIQAFRDSPEFKGWCLDSTIVHQDEFCITIKATISDTEGRLVACGLATEYVNSKNPKITENCETSAWGRALGNLGIGINESIASADEMKSFHNTVAPAKTFTPQPAEDAECPVCNQAATKLVGKFGPYIKCENCNKNYKTA